VSTSPGRRLTRVRFVEHNSSELTCGWSDSLRAESRADMPSVICGVSSSRVPAQFVTHRVLAVVLSFAPVVVTDMPL
jgi:hypothetical protein